MHSRATGQSNLAVVTQQLAKRALAIAIDAAPHRAKQGEARWSIANTLPAARLLIDQVEDDAHVRAQLQDAAGSLVETLADAMGRVADGFGHARPSYAPFAIHLLGIAAKQANDAATLDTVKQAATLLLNRHPDAAAASDPRLAAWRRLIARQHGLQEAEDLPLSSDEPKPLVSLGIDDLIDSWTYYELVGLHGLHLVSLHDKTAAERVRLAAEYHLGHTQPDYTTYQPWGLAAFAGHPQTAVFAEQQLHDVATHLSIEGPGGAVMPALLLADASATMAGRYASAWEKP